MPEVQPVLQPQPQTPVAKPRKKTNWKIISIIAVAAVILLAAAGYTVYAFGLFNKPPQETNKTATASATPSATKTPDSKPTNKPEECKSGEICDLLKDLHNKLITVITVDIRYETGVVHPVNRCYSWKLDNDNFITLKGYEFSISADKTSPNMEQFANIIKKASSTTVNSYFLDNGFIESDINSSLNSSLGDFDFRHCGQPSPEKGLAYSKNNIHCVGKLHSTGESRISFFCGEQDKTADDARKEFEDTVYNLLGKSMYFTVEKTFENYALIGVYPNDLVLKKENDKWIKVGEASYMQPPLCDYLDSKNIPRKLFGSCIKEDGSTWKSD